MRRLSLNNKKLIAGINLICLQQMIINHNIIFKTINKPKININNNNNNNNLHKIIIHKHKTLKTI